MSSNVDTLISVERNPDGTVSIVVRGSDGAPDDITLSYEESKELSDALSAIHMQEDENPRE